MEESDSFAAALKKAREIAAKMQVNSKPEPEAQAESKTEPSNQLVKTDSKKLALQIANNLSKRLPKNIRVLSEGVNRDGEMVVHMMIPAMLVCLFAGKDNETVAWLRKSNMVKVEMNLEHPYASTTEKPLTISGPPARVEAAREAVNRYIREKDELLGINANNLQMVVGNDYSELPIPKEAVGLVIGKQGENIKKINNETGCVVKFRPLTPYDDDRFRICTFHGTSSQVKRAREQMSELTEYIKQKYGLARPIPKPGQEFVEVRVSAQKAGIVIGKGGETIKQINNLSGAIVCIDRSIPDGADFRIFFVCGTPEQVEHAKYLIREKSGETLDEPVMESYMPFNPFSNFDTFTPNAPPFIPAFLPACVPQYPFDTMSGLKPMSASQNVYFQQPQLTAQQPQAATSIPQTQIPTSTAQSQAQPITSEAENAAAWAAYYQQYYASYYQQQQQPQQQEATPKQDGEVANSEQTPNQQYDYTQYWQAYYQQYYAQNPDAQAQLAQQQEIQPIKSTENLHSNDSLNKSTETCDQRAQDGGSEYSYKNTGNSYAQSNSPVSREEKVITHDYGHKDLTSGTTQTAQSHNLDNLHGYTHDRSLPPEMPPLQSIGAEHHTKVILKDYNHSDSGTAIVKSESDDFLQDTYPVYDYPQDFKHYEDPRESRGIKGREIIQEDRSNYQHVTSPPAKGVGKKRGRKPKK